MENSLLTHEEVDISRGVAERRRDLRAFATLSKWQQCSRQGYMEAVSESVGGLCKRLKEVQLFSLNDIRSFPQELQKQILADPRSPLFGDPRPIYESISLVDWLRYLPMFCQQCLGGTSFGLCYRQQDSIWMADKCVWVLEMICNELQGVKVYEAHHKIVDEKSEALSEEEVARIRRHLLAAVDEWHGLGVDPAKIAEELMATILYTTELKSAGMESIISDSEIHGKNPSLYGVMNWSARVFKDSKKDWIPKQKSALEKTIQMFLPILARIDVFLSRLPVYRTTLFRGIRAHIPASMYKTGLLIPWTALSSTTADFLTAYEFGYTLFIAHVYNAPAIDFATVYPEEAEHLMPTYSWVKAVSVMSPTLLRILGSTCNYITVQSAGDEPTIDELIERLIRKEESRLLIFEKFASRYVEASVHPAPPPLPHDAKAEPLFQAIQAFLVSESERHLLLLGSGGSGKSSALLAVYCELSRQSRIIRGKPVIPIFIPLPSSTVSVEGTVALDRALLHFLGVSLPALEEIAARCEIVVLLDSLDECGDQVKKRFPLLDTTKSCCKARVIVSCRTEYFSDKVSPSSDISTSSKAGACGVLHIQPLSRDQVDMFLEKASVDTGNPITVNDLLSLGVSEELLDLPVALSMGVEVVRKQREFGACVNAVPLLDFAYPERTRVGLYSAYLNTCRFRIKRELAGSAVNENTEIFDQEGTASLRKAIQDVAITMLAKGTWRLSLSEVRKMFEKYFGNSRDVVNDALNHSPMRLESLDDTAAEFSFWHKSIGEFLCVSALWGKESKRYLEMTGDDQCSAFSQRELGVLSFFNEISTSMERRNEVCGGTLLGTLVDSRRLKKQDVIVSNTVALLAVSQYPFLGVNLRNMVIKDCLVYEGNFRNSVLDGAYFEDCDLNRSDFEGASVEGTDFIRCTFSSLMHAPFEGHAKSVNSVCWSPDGKLVASGSEDNSIRLWEVASGREVRKLEGHTNFVMSVCWSPDGKLVASGSWDNSIRVWEVASGREVKKLEGHTNSVKSVCWSPDGKLVASGSSDKSIRVWEVASGREMKEFEGHTNSVWSVHWSPDGKLVASGSWDNSIRFWEAARGREVQKLEGHTDYVRSVCWSLDGKLVAAGSSDNSIRVWEVTSGQEVKKLEGHTNSVLSVCWSPDGKLVASGSWDNSIGLWEVASGREVKKLKGHTNSVNSVCWSPDGKLVTSGSSDKSVRVWEVASGWEVRKLEGHTKSVWSVFWSPDGELVASGSWDNSIRLWEVASGREVRKLDGHTNGVNSVCWSPNGKMIASGSLDKSIRLWEVASGREVRKLEGHNNGVKSVCWSSNSKLVASGSSDRSIRVWEVASGQEVKELEGHTSSVWSVRWSPDGKLVASGSNDCTIRLWVGASGREVKKLEGHTNSAWDVCWSPDGKLVASGSWDKSIRVWEVASGRELKKLEGHTNGVNSVCWSPDSKLVVAGSSDKSIRIWEVASGREVKKLEGHSNFVQSVCWSPDAKLIASGSLDKTIRVWEVASGREVKKLEGHTNSAWDVCWSPDGKLVASGSWDKSIRVWEVASGRELKKLEGHTNGVNSVCWSPDGKMIASGSWDKTIRVSGLPTMEAGKEFRTNAVTNPNVSLILGRNLPGIPPFEVQGELGYISRHNAFLSEYLFRNLYVQESYIPMESDSMRESRNDAARNPNPKSIFLLCKIRNMLNVLRDKCSVH